MAYIGLEPKSSHTIKYSQPFELVLFHITTINIKFHKGFYYPHLLHNYLFNYLNFLGLTYNTTGPTVCVEVHHMPLWSFTHYHNRQWPVIH